MQFDSLIFELIVCPKATCQALGKMKSCGWLDSYRYVHGVKAGKSLVLSIKFHHKTNIFIEKGC